MVNYKLVVRGLIMSLLAVSTIFSTFVAVPTWAGKGQGSGITPLSSDEVVELLYMREEEKLARDVYLLMHDLWSASIFGRIATSEQRHMDTMKKMLDKYGLTDPALPTQGEFSDDFLQLKHYEFTDKGGNSYVDGLEVGAFIEELDMIDIQEAIDVTTHVDVVNAYQHLLEGSKNHLRAFVGALETQGVIYTPLLISQELFDAIMGL